MWNKRRRGGDSSFEQVSVLVHTHIESMLRDQTKHAASLSEMRALSKD
jgi:hypothetical protein